MPPPSVAKAPAGDEERRPRGRAVSALGRLSSSLTRRGPVLCFHFPLLPATVGSWFILTNSGESQANKSERRDEEKP